MLKVWVCLVEFDKSFSISTSTICDFEPGQLCMMQKEEKSDNLAPPPPPTVNDPEKLE